MNIFENLSLGIFYYKLLVIGQVKSDSFGVTKAKLSYKYGLLRTIRFTHFVIDTII